MKHTFLIILILFLKLIVIAQENFSDNKPIEKGFVFIDGKYIEPPYLIENKGDTIYINNNKVEIIKYPTFEKERIFNSEPLIPHELERDSKLEQILTIIDPIAGKKYIDEAFGYFYSHFKYEEAQEKYLAYFRKFPNVKEIKKISSGISIECFNGDKQDFASFSEDKRFNHYWGPDGIGITNEYIGDKWIQQRLSIYIRELNNGSLLVILKLKRINNWSTIKVLKIMNKIIEINDLNITIDEKIKMLIENEVFYTGKEKDAEFFIKNLQISDECRKRIIFLNKEKNN